MESLNTIVSQLGGIVWGPAMLVLLLGTGLWLTLSLGFIQVRYLPKALKLILGKSKDDADGEISPLQALTTALSATVGTGNIAGVATAIASGGPGAIFWMWVTAFFGMATKYAEAVLAVKYRKKLEDGSTIGGPMYYLSEGLKQKWLGYLFAVFGIVASFGIGSMVQCNTVAASVKDAFGVNPMITGAVVTVMTLLVIIGGIKRIGRVTEKLVPFMAVFYFIVVMIIIVSNIDKLGSVFNLIFYSAFNPVAATGGFAGSVVRDAVRYGVARGVFSNESGLGSAPIAHAAAKTNNPVRQGLIAMTGTFFDTIVLCSLTAFAILLTGVWDSGKTGVELTSIAFTSTLGGNGKIILAVIISIFAYSTIIGWSYYGEQCSKFLFGVKFSYFYKVIYCVTIFWGAVHKTSFVWNVSDLFNGLMAVPNLIGLLGLSFVLMKLTKENIKDIK